MSSWTYPINGDIHYFTRDDKLKGAYTSSGVLRSMALFIDGLPNNHSVEAIVAYPERDGWSGMVAVFADNVAPAAAVYADRIAA